MKNIICRILLVSLILTASKFVNAQTGDREYLISKIRVFYIATPNISTSSIAQISANTIINSANIFGTNNNGNMDRFAEFLQQLFKPVSQGGMPDLQRFTASILRLNNKIVNMYIFNDYDQTITPATETSLGLCVSTDRRVWPCALHYSDSRGRIADTVAGHIKMGEKYFRDNGITVGRRTFLHEMMHTQDPSDRREHMWYSSALGQSFSYGSDNVHYFVELTPNITATYQEGIANTFTYLYSGIERRETINWFAENGECVVESARPASIPASMWLYSLISASNPPGPGRTPTSPRYNANIVSNYKLYRIAELPSKYILHNEKIMGIIASEFSRKVGFAKFMAALRQTNRDVTNVSTSPLARLIENFCHEALPSGLTVQDVTAVSRAQMPYLYPLALVDYFTYYRTNSKAEYRALFENLLPEVWVDLYWTAGKDIVRNAAKFTMTNDKPSGVQSVNSHIDAIVAALGLNSP
jgi:hypothetical protein